MTTIMESALDCKVEITNTKNKIHYASEWDPRQPAHTKGGYLDGRITIPDYDRPMKMTIQSYPAQGIGMKDALDAEVHPAIIHNVRMGRGKREQDKEPVPNDCHWRQEYLIENGCVKILNQLSSFDNGRNVPLRDSVTKVNNNKIVLGRKNNELNLIIVQPKQRSRADAVEATLTKVISNRLQDAGKDCSTAILNKLEKCFKGAEFGKNMKQVRLKVDMRDYQTNEILASHLSEQTIVDYTNMHIGPLDLADASPLKSCMEGGRKVIIASEQKLPKDVEPIFQIWSGETRMEDLEQYLSPITDFQIRLDSIIFLTPQQRNLAKLDWNDLTLKLAVRRIGDNHISIKKFTFRYVPHNMTNCIFCFHNLDTDEEVNIEKTKKRGKRALNMTNYIKTEVPQTLNDFNLKIEERSEGSSSPSNGYVSSPENVPSPPLPKKIQHDTPEVLIPSTVFELTTQLTTGVSFGSSMSTTVNTHFSSNDLMEFGKYVANLPPLIKKDGEFRFIVLTNYFKIIFVQEQDRLWRQITVRLNFMLTLI